MPILWCISDLLLFQSRYFEKVSRIIFSVSSHIVNADCCHKLKPGQYLCVLSPSVSLLFLSCFVSFYVRSSSCLAHGNEQNVFFWMAFPVVVQDCIAFNQDGRSVCFVVGSWRADAISISFIPSTQRPTVLLNASLHVFWSVRVASYLLSVSESWLVRYQLGGSVFPVPVARRQGAHFVKGAATPAQVHCSRSFSWPWSLFSIYSSFCIIQKCLVFGIPKLGFLHIVYLGMRIWC